MTQPQPQQLHSTITSLLVTAAVALISGVLGAMAYAHFLGPKPGESASSRFKTAAHSSDASSPGAKAGADSKSGAPDGTSTPASRSPSLAGSKIDPEADDLKQQMKELNKQLDRLAERVDRLQELLSLTVPLLQRLAPKQ